MWRTDKEQIEHDLHSGSNQLAKEVTDRESVIRMIMRDWGMNRREAEKAYNHRSYFCFLLTHDQRKVGLVYMDSPKESAFVGKHRDRAIKTANDSLAPAVAKVIDGLSSASLQIDLETD